MALAAEFIPFSFSLIVGRELRVVEEGRVFLDPSLLFVFQVEIDPRNKSYHPAFVGISRGEPIGLHVVGACGHHDIFSRRLFPRLGDLYPEIVSVSSEAVAFAAAVPQLSIEVSDDSLRSRDLGHGPVVGAVPGRMFMRMAGRAGF